jgi:hypothetical protein
MALLLGFWICVVGLAAAPSSLAAALKIQALTLPNGTGRLVVKHGGAPWLWDACFPDRSNCRPFGSGQEVETRDASAGTVFRVRSQGRSGFSPEWRGRLIQIGEPTISGTIRINEFVSPVPGQWKGGWKSEYSEMQLAACLTATGESCTTLTHPYYLRECSSDSSFVLEERFEGAYLRVANRRVGASPPGRPAVALTSPYGGEVWGRRRDTAVAMLGPIAAPTRTYLGECGPPPPGNALIDAQGHALIDCPAGCRATLVASRKGREISISRMLPPRNALVVRPPTEMRLTSQAIRARLGAGRIRIAVKLNGETTAHRLVGVPGLHRHKHSGP